MKSSMATCLAGSSTVSCCPARRSPDCRKDTSVADPTTREPGQYWVRFADGDWFVAYCHGRSWNGLLGMIEEAHLAEIDERRLVRAGDRTFHDRAEPGADGSVRKAHYGEGEQPWDLIVHAGWGAEFAAGCVLRYLRRTKDPAHSLESARWYWERLAAMDNAQYVRGTLRGMLAEDELKRLEDA
jgi:hypothetical protein